MTILKIRPRSRKYVELTDYLVLLKYDQCGSVVRIGGLNAGDPGSYPRLGLQNEFVLGDPRSKFTMLCK